MIELKGKEILGMIHLAGPSIVDKALEEIAIYERQGLYGCIIENYHGSVNDVIYTLKALQKTTLKTGINILPNDFKKAYEIAKEYDVDFIQMDYISGTYKPNIKLDIRVYGNLWINNSNIFVMGGVWPKYYNPIEGSNLLDDLNEAHMICDGIVVTGSGTGQETPLDKIKVFKEFLTLKGGVTPLIIGAGLDKTNVKEQMRYADGAIVGSAFKPEGRTNKMVDEELVKEFMTEFLG